MGFYLRKSVRVGPIRFNLSKSGIGVSAGIRGLRIGTGPRGNYVHMGRHGIYYRRTLRSPRRRRSSRHGGPPNPGESVGTGSRRIVTSDSAAGIIDSDSAAFISELTQKRRRIRIWPLFAASSSVLLVFCLAVGLPGPMLAVVVGGIVAAGWGCRQYDSVRKTAVLMYDLEGPVLEAYRSLCESMESMSRSSAVLAVASEHSVRDRKYHAGAERLIDRARVWIGYSTPSDIRVNVSVPCMRLPRLAVYFFPDRILVDSNRRLGGVSYSSIQVSCGTTEVIENGAPPRDAVVVGHSWKYVNKSGGPDRRFRDNYQLPICQYDELSLSSDAGLTIVLQVSRRGAAGAVVEALSQLQSALVSASTGGRSHGNTNHSAENNGASSNSQNEQDLHAALFDVLCFAMVVDGRVSRSEKATLREILSAIDVNWPDDYIRQRLAWFIDQVESKGLSVMRKWALGQAEGLLSHGRGDLLLWCVGRIIESDGRTSKREAEFVRTLRSMAG